MEAGGPVSVLAAERGEMCATIPPGWATPSQRCHPCWTPPCNLTLHLGLASWQESLSTRVFIPGAANIQSAALAEMLGASSLPKSPSDLPWAHVSTARPAEQKSWGLWLRNNDALIWTAWWNSSPRPHPAEQDGWPFFWSSRLCYGDPKSAFNHNMKNHSPLLPILASAKKKKKDKHSLFRRWKLALSCLLLSGKEQQTYYYFAIFSPNFIFQPAYVFGRLLDF